MIKLEIKKTTFFFCGPVSLSKTSKPTVELDINSLEAKVVKGILRGVGTGAIVCTEGIEELLNKSKDILDQEEAAEAEKLVAEEVQEQPVIEEQEVKVEPEKKTTNPRTKKKVETEQE